MLSCTLLFQSNASSTALPLTLAQSRELDPESREEFAVPALQNARVQTRKKGREGEGGAVHLHARCQ